MLNEKERRFLEYWEKNRMKEKRIQTQLLLGIPVGLLFAIPILLSVFSSRYWYKRADEVANAQTSPVVLMIAVIVIAIFVALFYKRHQWDMKDQYYQQLKEREKKEAAGSKEVQR